jgi:hypothetical protein
MLVRTPCQLGGARYAEQTEAASRPAAGAHREAKVNSCCSAPDEVYAAVESANPLAADLPNEIAEFE